MRHVEMIVTPTQAVRWLEGNVHNRSVRDSVVERLSRDMKAGKWLLTHQGIAFDKYENDKDKTLVDGQHRLFAIVDADVPVRMMVSYGVPLSAQAVIDDNLPRTMVDVLKITYGKDDTTNLHIAIAKRLKMASTLKMRGKLSRQELIEALDAHGPAVAFAIDAFPRAVRGVKTAPVLTVIARAWYTQNREAVARFCQILSDGRTHSESEDAARMLRNWLMEKTSIGSALKKGRAEIIYSKTERALHAFLQGESLGRLYTASTELFPLPAERPPKMAKIAKAAKGVPEDVPAPLPAKRQPRLVRHHHVSA